MAKKRTKRSKRSTRLSSTQKAINQALYDFVVENDIDVYGSSIVLDFRGVRVTDVNTVPNYYSNLAGADLTALDWDDIRELRSNDVSVEGAKLPSLGKVTIDDFEPDGRFADLLVEASLSDALILALMRADAKAHGDPNAFDVWAAGGRCPYTSEPLGRRRGERRFQFEERRDLWRRGDPPSDAKLLKMLKREVLSVYGG